jgi:hypothetical protein
MKSGGPAGEQVIIKQVLEIGLQKNLQLTKQQTLAIQDENAQHS